MEERIINYLKGHATESEERKIYKWFSSSKANQDYFYKIKAKYVASKFDDTSRDVNIDDLFLEFKNRTNTTSPQSYSILKYAVAIALIISTGYFGYYNYSGKSISKTPTLDGAITLEMPNGSIKIMDEAGKMDVLDANGNMVGKQQGRQLVYNELVQPNQKDVLEYNTLTVPYAKQFELVLSDDTRVILNSGTSIKYPVKFVGGKERKVFLQGEAFFDVKRDTLHPFIVSTGEINVRVLGTKFNVSSYSEDDFVNTVLEEGLVNVYDAKDLYDPDQAVFLKPGQIAVWDKTKKNVNVGEADMDIHLAWKNGKIVLKHTPFKNIIKKLERHYNVEITNNNLELNNQSFTASFDAETIEEVFEAFSEGYGLQYSIKGKKIIINP